MTDDKIEKLTPVFKTYTNEQLKMKRRLLGYSQNDIAVLCGVTSETIRNVESGRTNKASNYYLIGACLEKLALRCTDKSVLDALYVLDI